MFKSPFQDIKFVRHFKSDFPEKFLDGQKVYKDQEVIIFLTKKGEEKAVLHASTGTSGMKKAQESSYLESSWSSFETQLQANNPADFRFKHFYSFNTTKFESLLFAQLWSVLGEGKAENVYQAVLQKNTTFSPNR